MKSWAETIKCNQTLLSKNKNEIVGYNKENPEKSLFKSQTDFCGETGISNPLTISYIRKLVNKDFRFFSKRILEFYSDQITTCQASSLAFIETQDIKDFLKHSRSAVEQGLKGDPAVPPGFGFNKVLYRPKKKGGKWKYFPRQSDNHGTSGSGRKGESMKSIKRVFLIILVLTLAVLPSAVFASGELEKIKDSYPVKSFEPELRPYTQAENGKEVEINIFSTNDEHGWVFDWDFGQGGPRMYRGNPRPSGLARVSTIYKDLSLKYDNPILISTGDTIQGSILSYYYNFIKTNKPNPMSVLFEKMGYEAWVIGNHEVEQGNEVMFKVANEMAAAGVSVLSANAVWEDDPTVPFYKPYMIKEVDGVRIGLLGLTTPGIPMWLADSTHEEHIFLDMVATAEYVVPILRNVEKCDVVVGVFHSGMNEDYDIIKAKAAGVPAPNASGLVAQAIGGGPDGFDAIITAHSHKAIDDSENTEYRDERSNVVNGVKFLQAKNWGEMLGHLSITVKGVNGEWVVQDVAAMTHPVAEAEEDPEILNYMDDYIAGALAYAETMVAEATADLPSRRSYYEETAIVDLIQETQLHFSGADISIAAAFNPNLTIAEGDITVGNIAGIYIYENFLYAVEMTGHQIKDYLEYSSKFFNTLSMATVKSMSLVNPDIRGYNYDMAQGFLYDLDLSKSPGNRIINMKNLDGTPFDMEKTYEVTLNSYRYNGGGGHLEAAGVLTGGVISTETTYQSSMPMRDLMVEYLKLEGEWGPEDIEYNWKLVPETLSRMAVELQLAASGADR